MLTARQQDLLRWIAARTNDTGVAPTFVEMREFMNVSSNSTINSFLEQLEDRGYIRRLRNKARAIEVLSAPGRKCKLCGALMWSNAGDAHGLPKAARRLDAANSAAPGSRKRLK